MVIDGKRNLSHESIKKCSEALMLNQQESRFFTHLVLLNQAQTDDEKRYYAEQLVRSRPYRKLHPLKSAQYDYYTKWYFVAIREMVATKEFQEDPEWVAKALEPQISVSEARFALESLIRLKLIERNTAGKLFQTSQSLTTGDEVDSVAVSQFHKEMLKKGSESIERFSPQERDISSLSFGAGPDTARKIKELIQRFRKDVADVLLGSQEESAEVYQLCFQLFPLTSVGKKAAGKR